MALGGGASWIATANNGALGGGGGGCCCCGGGGGGGGGPLALGGELGSGRGPWLRGGWWQGPRCRGVRKRAKGERVWVGCMQSLLHTARTPAACNAFALVVRGAGVLADSFTSYSNQGVGAQL